MIGFSIAIEAPCFSKTFTISKFPTAQAQTIAVSPFSSLARGSALFSNKYEVQDNDPFATLHNRGTAKLSETTA